MTAAARSEPLQTDVLVVPGMHCAGCMAKVERGLGAMPGVAAARVNLTARQVSVSHAPDVSVPALVDALADIGFAAQPRAQSLDLPPSAVKPLLAPLAVAGFACMNVMLLSVSVWSGADGATRDLFHWLSALIGVPAIAYSGRPFFASALGALRRMRTNMDVPISIGIVLATGLSIYETATHGEEAWFDGTLMLLLFLLAGRALDAMMRDRARAGVESLLRQAASGTMVVDPDGTVAWHMAQDLMPGMTMRVAAGERLAADGIVRHGSSRFDQALLTGESAAIAAAPGDRVLAGTLNLDAPVDVEVTAAGRSTVLAEIARLMDDAGQTRSAYVRIADRAARLYAPAVHTLAAITFIGWLFAGAGFESALATGIAVLIITCPCALGLAVPVAQVVTCGALMKRGIMVKDGSALERMAAVNRALFDKTGTLTLGRLVPDSAALDALGDNAAVALALASHSRHPLSRALTAALAARGITAARLDDITERPGEGVFGTWNGHRVALQRPETRRSTAVVLRIADAPAQVIGFADRLRPGAKRAIADLAALGIPASILSGDSAQAVDEVARETGLDAQAEVGPIAKLQAIKQLGTGNAVLMVGDGLNDGPALAAAHASMAPGDASDVGLQAADVVFLGDSLDAVPTTIHAARRTLRVVRQNFALAIGYNLIAVPLAMAGLVTPLIAAAAMSVSSLIVVANSLRLARVAR